MSHRPLSEEERLPGSKIINSTRRQKYIYVPTNVFFLRQIGKLQEFKKKTVLFTMKMINQYVDVNFYFFCTLWRTKTNFVKLTKCLARILVLLQF